MPAFTKDELIAASELRTMSQRHLFQALEEHGKLGILFKDSLAAVLLPHSRYEALVNRVKELEKVLHTRYPSENEPIVVDGSTHLSTR